MRVVAAIFLAIICGLFGFAAGAGLGGAWAGVVGAALASAATAWWTRRSDLFPGEHTIPRAWRVVSLVAATLATIQLGRLTVFMVDANAPEWSSVPNSAWEVQHSCLTAYFVAGKAIDTGDVYDDSLYNAPDDDPAKIRKPRMMGPFRIDVFEYPPPFLLLPRALLVLAPEFFPHRALWFGLGSLFVLGAMLVVARHLGPASGTRALLLLPLVWLALPTLSTLQKGNVQGVVIAAAMLAMVAFERRRWAVGGFLLAFATASKLYPGMLIVYLIVRGQWRAVAWTAAMGIAIVAVSLLDTGWAPYVAFLDHLPGLTSGQAFPAFRNPMATAINFSIPGLVWKAKLFGVEGMGFPAASLVGWVYTIVAVALTAMMARRAGPAERAPLTWLAVLILGTLRSPFLPQSYAAFPPLWLLTLIAANPTPSGRVLVSTLAAWAALNIYWPHDWPMPPERLALLSGVPQAVTIALALLVARAAMSGSSSAMRTPSRSVGERLVTDTST